MDRQSDVYSETRGPIVEWQNQWTRAELTVFTEGHFPNTLLGN